MEMDALEKVLHQAPGQARPIADFLHENEIDGVTVDQDVTLNEGRDAKLPFGFRDMDMDDAEGPDIQKDVGDKEPDSKIHIRQLMLLLSRVFLEPTSSFFLAKIIVKEKVVFPNAISPSIKAKLRLLF
nr:cell cycle checkpoint protein RAD17 [Tanacetum cinerariifolium]